MVTYQNTDVGATPPLIGFKTFPKILIRAKRSTAQQTACIANMRTSLSCDRCRCV